MAGAALLLLAACHGGKGQPELPAISAFSSAKDTITAGTSTTLTAQFSGGEGVVDHGVGTLTSGTMVKIQPGVDTTYTLTVSGQGSPATQTCSVKVVPAAVAMVSAPLNATTGVTGLKASVAAQPGCTYVWSIAGGSLTAGDGTPEVTFTAGAVGTLALTCTVSNALGDASAPGTAQVQVVASPVIDTFSVSPSPIGIGGGAVLRHAFRGGTGVVTPGSWTVLPGGTTNVAPAATTEYTLTVTNAAGMSITAPATLAVDATPFGIQSFASSSTQVVFGAGANLSWQLTGIPAQLTVNGASVLGASSLLVHPARRQVFTLDGGNAAGTGRMAVTVAARGLDLLAGNLDGAGALDGKGPAARFHEAKGMVQDGAGNLLVVDGERVRRVTPGGDVTTYTGKLLVFDPVDGALADARFLGLSSIARGADGKLYLSDYNSIRTIATDGTVTTLAGDPNISGSLDGTGPAARFYRPGGLAVDASGNAYVAEPYNHTIRKVTPAGEVTTFAGAAGAPGAVDGTGTDARFNSPWDVALDRAGNLWVADQGNSTIRKITPTRVVTTEAGKAGDPGYVDGIGTAARFGAVSSLAFSASGDLLIGEAGRNYMVRRMRPGGSVTTVAGRPWEFGYADGPADVAEMANVRGLLVNASGEIFVTHETCIRKIDGNRAITTVAGLGPHRELAEGTGADARFGDLGAMSLSASGMTYVAEAAFKDIRTISPSGKTGTFMIGWANHDLEQITGLAVDPSGPVYVADAANHAIWKYSTSGAYTLFAGAPRQSGFVEGPGTAARFNQPEGICLDAQGNLYVADRRNYCIRKITPAGVVSTLAGVAGDSNVVDGVASLARFSAPNALVADASGNLYVVDGLRLRKLTPDGTVTTLAGQDTRGYADGAGADAKFASITALAVDLQGNILVSDTGNHLIRKVTPAGVVTTLAGQYGKAGSTPGALPAILWEPQGLAVTADGDVLVATGNGIVQITAP